MDKTFSEIMNEKAKQTCLSQKVSTPKASQTNTSFKKKYQFSKNKENFEEDYTPCLKNILKKPNEVKNSSFSNFDRKEIKNNILKKYASSNFENFIIEEETGQNIDDSGTSRSNTKYFTEYSDEKQNKSANKNLEIKKEEHDNYYGEMENINRQQELDYANDLVGYCLESESKNKLFKVTEEDTNNDKFSITVNSDKFRSNSIINSELNSLKKKANESEAQIKDIYQVDLEKENFKKMIQKDIKLSVHGNYDEMNSSNEAKFNTYKSDMRNKHFNTQINGETEQSKNSTGIKEGYKEETAQEQKIEESQNIKKQDNGMILDKIQESFSDHEDDIENIKADVESSCVRETYTVDSSSDDQEINDKNDNDNSIFSDISQVNYFYIKSLIYFH